MKRQKILLERPAVGGDGEYIKGDDKSELLPANARAKGYQLLSMEFCRDPYVLYNRFGQVAYQWDCYVTPTWLDAFIVCRDLGLT